MSFEIENPKKARQSRLENEKKNSKKGSVSDFSAFMKGKQVCSDGPSETDSIISIDFMQEEKKNRAPSNDVLISTESLADGLTQASQERLVAAETLVERFLRDEVSRREAEEAVGRVFLRLHSPVAQFDDFRHLELYGASLVRCHSLYPACAVARQKPGLCPALVMNGATAITAASLSEQAHSFHAAFRCRPNDLVSFVAPGREQFASLVLFATMLDNSVCFMDPETGGLRWKVEMRDSPLKETRSATTAGDRLLVVNSDWMVQEYQVEYHDIGRIVSAGGRSCSDWL